METIMFKLVSGDVVMGKGDLSKIETDEKFIVEKPMQLMLDPTQGGVGMIPYDAIFSQSEIDSQEFRTKDVMHTVEIHDSFKEAYLKQTTGIELSTPELDLGVA